MRTITSLCSIFALTLALGCGGGDGDGGGDGADAAPPAADAGPTFDAAPDFPAVTTGVGQVCVAASPTCASTVTTGCVTFAQGATEGICTFVCATGIADGAQPEAAAHNACVAEYSGTTGTPLCAISVNAANGVSDYVCGVLCGMIGENDAGGCPGGLTCTNNTCIPE